jgi:O-acetyl-ADP-ribose deacetylase (regulator of RNase III)
LTGSEDDLFESSRARTLVESWYPAPIARAFARVAARADTDLALSVAHLASVTIQYLALLALRDLLARPKEARSAETGTWLKALDGAPLSDGRWLGLLRHALARGREAPVAPAAFDPEVATVFLEGGLDQRLSEVVSIRNDVVHEKKLERTGELKLAIAGVLTGLPSLRFHRLVVPRELEKQEGEIARWQATLYRGHASPFPQVTLTTDVSLEKGRVYLSRRGQSELLLLHPCLVEARCKACGNDPELFLLASRDGKKRRVDAVAAATGHALEDPEAKDAEHAWSRVVDLLDKRPGRLTPRRLDVGGDSLVARRRFAAGELVDGRFRIARFIASGGMADVYEAEESGRRVALKLLPLELARSEETIRRFEAEIVKARLLEHRNVVRYLDHGEDRGDQFLALELATGWAGPTGERLLDLARYVHAAGPLDEARVRAIARDVAQGLHAIHEKGIVHRDLKPANLLLFEEAGAPVVKVSDFGVSRESGALTLTLTGFTVGTPEYMAPEQASAAEGQRPGPEADIYALGVILYELLLGTVPFKGATAFEVAHRHQTENPERRPEWKQRGARASAGMSRLVMKCLRKDPGARYRSARELYADLEKLETGGAVEEAGPGLGPGFKLGHYVLEKEVARTAQATVHEALDESTQEKVRLGVLSRALDEDPAGRERALERLRAAQRARHPALLRIREIQEEQGFAYFVTDRPRGWLVGKLDPLAAPEAARLVLELAAAVVALGGDHGAISPENVAVEHGAALNPFLETSGARIVLGPPALGGGTSDVQGLASVLAALLGDTGGEDKGAGGEPGKILERARAGEYGDVRALGEALAGFLKGPKEPPRDPALPATLSVEVRRTEGRSCVLEVPVAPGMTFDALTDQIFFALVAAGEKVRPYDYGKTWVLRRPGGPTIAHAWMSSTRRRAGELVADTRPLHELGIEPGMHLEAVDPRRLAPADQRFALGRAVLIIEEGDLTRAAVDAIVNTPDNATLSSGGPLYMAVHSSAGPELAKAVRLLGGRCPVGEARLTPGFWLSARYVIHTPAPGHVAVEPGDLASAYKAALGLANAHRLRSIAFPAISCGGMGWPLDEAAQIALETCRDHVGELEEVRFVFKVSTILAAWRKAAQRILPRSTGDAAPASLPEAKPRDLGAAYAEARLAGDRAACELLAIEALAEKDTAEGRARLYEARLEASFLGRVVETGAGPIHAVAVSPDGRFLASGGEERLVRVFELPSLAKICEAKGHQGDVRSLAFAPDGRSLLDGGKDGTVRKLGLPEGEHDVFHRERTRTDALAISKEGIAAWGAGNRVHAIDLAGGPIRDLDGPTSTVTALVFDAAGRVVVACEDASIVTLGPVPKIVSVHDARGTGGRAAAKPARCALAASPDGRFLAAAHGRHLVVFEAGKPPVLLSKERTVRALAWSRDWLASGAEDGTIALHSIRDLTPREAPVDELAALAEEVARSEEQAPGSRGFVSLRAHGSVVSSLAFTPDGRWLVSGSQDKTVRLWDVRSVERTAHASPAELAREAEVRLGRRVVGGSVVPRAR